MGRIRIFCVLEQRSARDSVIFLWVALSVEWGLENLEKHQSQIPRDGAHV